MLNFRFISVLTLATGMLFSQASDAELKGLDASVVISVKKNSQRFLCTGAMIDAHTIVTAAHCLQSGASVLVTNERDASDAKNWRVALTWKIHPGYNGNNFKSVDLGVIKLKDSIPATPYFSLTEFNAQVLKPADLERVGYGGRDMSPSPTKVDGKDINNSKKMGVLKNIRTLISGTKTEFKETGIFFSVDDQFGYEGDSGGPVFVRKNSDQLNLVGVHSGRALDEAGKLINISNFLPLNKARIDWIKAAFLKP